MNKMGIFFAGAFVGSLTTFITMCLASCSKPEAENDQHKRQVEELTEKHWNECRQIAHYADENKRMKEQIEQLIKKYE